MKKNSKKVIIVDDNYLSAEGININIDWTSLDAEVISIQNDGIQAQEFLKENPADLIISDIEMPGLNGLEMSEKILQIQPNIKIILISAYDKFEYAKQAIRIGAYDYIEKPINYDYLYNIIKSALDIIDQNLRQLEILKKSRPAIISNFFNNLIHSYSDEVFYSLSSYPEYLNLDINYSYYTVIKINIENSSEIKSKYGVEEYHLYLMNLYNYTTLHCTNFSLNYIINEMHNFVCIVGHNSKNRSEFQKKVYSFASEIVTQFEKNILQINIGIGTTIKNIWDLNISYKSSCNALEYRFFYPQRNIFDARDSIEKNISIKLFSENKEDQLIQLICKRDRNAISDWIKDFSNELLSDYNSKSLIFTRIYSVLGRILKFLYEMDMETSDVETRILRIYSQIDTVSDAGQLFKWLDNISKVTCDKLDLSTKNYHEQMSEAVISYIEQNYERNSLSLNEIAEYMNVSPAHLSALFKKNTGRNISEVLTSVRIETACQLLMHTNYSLKEISEKIGYTNQYYFSSCFKKKTGKTPSEYRNEYLASKK